MQERRCAQIAELLAQGVKGVALTSAVQAWDKESGASPGTDGVFVAEPGVATAKTSRVRTRAKTDPQVVPVQVDARGRSEMRSAKDAEVASAKTRSVSSAQQARFNVSLTSMFRRASSVPLVPTHDSPGTYAPVSSVPAFSPPPLSPASSVSYCSDSSFPDSDNASVGVFLLVLFCSDVSSYFHFLFRSGFSPVRFRPLLSARQPVQHQHGQQRDVFSRAGHGYSRSRSLSGRCRAGALKFLLELLDSLRLGRHWRRHSQFQQRQHQARPPIHGVRLPRS
jgi:hypothetical protein